MATYTRAQLIAQVLRELSVLDANEAPEAEDSAVTNQAAQTQLEILYEDGLIPFDVDTDKIPARYFLPLVSKIAYRLVNTYSAFDRAEKLLSDDTGADRRLNKLRQKATIDAPTAVDYF